MLLYEVTSAIGKEEIMETESIDCNSHHRTMSSKHQVAIIGLGHCGYKTHFSSLHGSESVNVVTVCENNKRLHWRDSASLTPDIPAYRTVEDLIAHSRPDFAIIALPHDAHPRCVALLSKGGIPILKEKGTCREDTPKEAAQPLAASSGSHRHHVPNAGGSNLDIKILQNFSARLASHCFFSCCPGPQHTTAWLKLAGIRGRCHCECPPREATEFAKWPSEHLRGRLQYPSLQSRFLPGLYQHLINLAAAAGRKEELFATEGQPKVNGGTTLSASAAFQQQAQVFAHLATEQHAVRSSHEYGVGMIAESKSSRAF
ncbi:hypothetical protein CERZMDRAFT_92177 [Cercospora zeae-maydis SCOH1-5]|uniref:Gfo/Idh/MocA-like oxidoreductase N-terminal domain-containing protein n=1 Tax=Cercospora zeae-maydis SCOH1-5 TaxID=717836 RepID=A0A6A6FVN0_9PEZI|nr:hypothetical protein CERZMDRAFT_92177 [Cercospora zeae-maydis SCOH1-5]